MSDAPPPQSSRLAVLVPFGIVTLIWGSTWLVIRDQITIVPPTWSIAYRFAIAGVAMLGYAAWRGERMAMDARGWRVTAAIAVLQFCLNFNLVYRAELYVTSGLVAVVFALLLLPNALLGRVFLGQRLGRQLVIGSAIAMAGIILLFVHEARVDPSGPVAALTGIGLTLLAVLAASLANVLQASEAVKRYAIVPMLGYAMLIGAGIDATYALVTVGPPVIELRIGYWAGILYLALAASALAFSLYFQLLRVIGPAKAAYSSVIIPVIAMTLSTLFEGYRWSLLAGLGAALAIIGLVVALKARRPAR